MARIEFVRGENIGLSTLCYDCVVIRLNNPRTKKKRSSTFAMLNPLPVCFSWLCNFPAERAVKFCFFAKQAAAVLAI